MSGHHAQRVHTENVVLDIGDGIGGLIVYTPGTLLGREIEVVDLAQAAPKIHCQVDERIFNGRTIFAGVFSPLAAGEYRVCRPVERADERLTVASGQVTEVDWRGGEPTSTLPASS